MKNQRRHRNSVELSGRRQVEVAEAFPNRLLHASGDSKRRQIVGNSGIGKIAGDAQLEVALSIGLRISLTQTGFREIGAQLDDIGACLSPVELRLELSAILAIDRGRVDEHQPARTVLRSARRCLDREEHRE